VGVGMDLHGAPLIITLESDGRLFVNDSKFTDCTTARSDGVQAMYVSVPSYDSNFLIDTISFSSYSSNSNRIILIDITNSPSFCTLNSSDTFKSKVNIACDTFNYTNVFINTHPLFFLKCPCSNIQNEDGCKYRIKELLYCFWVNEALTKCNNYKYSCEELKEKPVCDYTGAVVTECGSTSSVSRIECYWLEENITHEPDIPAKCILKV
jgi:hypothetical protein